ncbi:MAG: hypothetical protein Q9211_004982 [Gyalolechia sp. 1 TL-2023]
MKKTFKNVNAKGVQGNTWKKFTQVSVARGQTAWPKSPNAQETIGVRYDFDGEVTQADGVYNKFNVQPNAGKIPSTFKAWRDENGGTHAVMTVAMVKKNGTKTDVEMALTESADAVRAGPGTPGGEKTGEAEASKK